MAALLMLLAYPLIAAAAFPGPGRQAPVRLALLRAAVITGGYAVLSTELLSWYKMIGLLGFCLVWLVAIVIAAAVLAWRRQKINIVVYWRHPVVWALGALALGTFVLAIGYRPNNFDSMTYHLPRIEHWLRQGTVDLFAVRIHRQVTFPPGAEYVLLHLRVLSGGDALLNLPQWFAAVGCVLAASRITLQLGGGRTAQLLTAVVAGSAPIVLLEASSTQNDLITALWVASLATILLDFRLADAPLLGLATGLIAVTKMTALFAAAPLLLWWGIRLVRERPWWTVAATGGLLGLAASLCTPFLLRIYAEWGNPLGPEYLGDSVTMQRHDPAAILVNGLKIGQGIFDLPVLGPLAAAAVRGVAGLLGVGMNDPAANFGPAFPQTLWYPDEDRASYPLQAALILAGLAYCVLRRRIHLYPACFAGAILLHVSMLKWQMWGNRLTVYLLILGAPLAGLLLAALARRWRRTTAALVAVMLLVGGATVAYGWPRRLAGPQSLFTLDEMGERFARRPAWEADFRWAAGAVGGARKIGLAQANDSWEYPWWVLLGDRDWYALQTMVASRPAADPLSMDAIVCMVEPVTACANYQPPGWSRQTHGRVAVILPPGLAR
ncbi:hypothetical protein [Longispora albida]|uniref:hypothetical protein n=1 Tax=Longispora albida TaxID=203523 RepID=UPI000367510A|nr:hypothetical protein [Longispora albida]